MKLHNLLETLDPKAKYTLIINGNIVGLTTNLQLVVVENVKVKKWRVMNSTRAIGDSIYCLEVEYE